MASERVGATDSDDGRRFAQLPQPPRQPGLLELFVELPVATCRGRFVSGCADSRTRVPSLGKLRCLP